MANKLFPGVGRVAVIHDCLAESGDVASQDVFDQMEAVESTLRGQGVAAQRLAVGLDLGAFKADLLATVPHIVFNLVESLDRSDRLQTIIPLLLEDWRVPFTGSGSAAMLLSNNKIESKRRLAERGLPVPECVWLDADGRARFLPRDPSGDIDGDWIVKTLESHASLFLDDASVLRSPGRDGIEKRLREAGRTHGTPFFAERFVDGREFNITVLEKPGGGPEVMPAAEIRFDALPPDRPRIVGYAAKWEEESQEYLATPRSFEFAAADAGLLGELAALAEATWDVLGLAGYARVDFRVDRSGRAFILEANTNPCLTPDAGLAAAAERGGIGYAELLDRIIRAGRKGC